VRPGDEEGGMRGGGGGEGGRRCVPVDLEHAIGSRSQSNGPERTARTNRFW